MTRSIRLLMLAMYLAFSFDALPVQVMAAVPAGTNTWIQLSNTKLISVCPSLSSRPELFGPKAEPRDCHTITSQWGSGAWDETNNRLIILGGGHGTYMGNEPYALDLDGTPSMSQLDLPPPASAANSAYTNCRIMSNGEPGGRHTNDNIAWIDSLGGLILVGGAGSCTAGSVEEDMWIWDPISKVWIEKYSNLRSQFGFNASSGGADAGVVYDKTRNKVWFHDCWQIYEYTPNTNAVAVHGMSNGCQVLGDTFYITWLYDPLRSRYVGTGEGYVVWVTVGGSGSYSWNMQTTSGTQACQSFRGPGMVYDPVQDRYVCFAGGNSLYVLNPTTWAWTTVAVSGTAPTLAYEAGTNFGQFGRFQYSAKENAFVFCGDVNFDCYAVRLTSGGSSGGGGGSSDLTAPSTPGNLSASANSSSQINLTWNASTDNVGIAGYKVFRNSTQIATPTSASYSDTGLSASTTYVYTVVAYDAAGNQSGQSTSASATTLPQSSGGSDFQSRCSTAGVIICRGWDSPSELNPPVWPNSGIYPAESGLYLGTYDGTVKASGNGSLRFEIRGGTGANSAGMWWEQFGRSFGAGQTFYVQFKQRFSPEMLGVNMGGNGWKQVIFHNRQGGSCAGLEITTQHIGYYGFPSMYTDCGSQLFSYSLSNGDVVNQYSNAYPPGSDGTIYCLYHSFGSSTNKCLYYQPNQWMTFYYKITVGAYGQANSTIQAWAGYEGQPLVQFINRSNYTLHQDTSGLDFDILTLTVYDSRKDGRAHPTAYSWYDDLIISTQPIPASAGGGGSTNPPPAAPTNLRVN